MTITVTMLATARAAEPRRAADLVLRNGRVVTMDPACREAQAIAIRGDRIAAVGPNAEVQRWIGPRTRVIDLRGRLTIPGFIDSHAHFVELGRSKQILDLTTARSYEDIVLMVGEAASRTPAGRWIVGRGWHQEKWDRPPQSNVEGYPTHDALSRAAPDHPVVLTHGTGHMCLANAKAMQLAGVDAQTKDPPGGKILRDARGQPTGVFREEAAGLIYRAKARTEASRSPQQKRQELDEAIRLAAQECLANGVTTCCDAGASFEEIERFRQLAEQGELPVRLWVMIGESNAEIEKRMPQYRMVGVGGNHLTVRAIKRFMDGALGTHGAWMLQPYSDLPNSSGMRTIDPDDLRRTAELAIRYDLQLCVHAIGDRANREVLNLFEEVFRAHPQKRDFRWRIEHAQHLHPDDIPRFAQLGVIASMQGVHATSDAPFVVKRLGVRRAREGAYAWRSLLDAGAIIANGTDAPVERISPIECFYASVTRRPRGKGPFFAHQCMSRDEALRSYTIDAAYAAFEEALIGSLTPGKLADIVVLSRDILTIPAPEILKTKVVYTIVGGQVLYEAGSG
ncbi:MAG: amidohydrolase [Planctomycetes bacterium]|nr:amidohydrolase [Planctomycetota bacterium]